ncbi:MAG TPA: tetratricopeptide repeat protein [Vicinamibacterales bacterium]|nr:tetratricopeptide repeat protein [Vicinamibacterales bacterium]
MRQRLHVLQAALVALCVIGFAGPAFAQIGRVGGSVKDPSGKPVAGATVTAQNPNASPSSFTTKTDKNGDFSLMGMSNGVWAFTASAPNFAPSSGKMNVSTLNSNPPLDFTLKPGGGGEFAGVNAKQLQGQLAAADALFNSKQYQQAIDAYEAILKKAPTLTVLDLQIGAAYRNLKEYDKAIGVYNDMLKADPNSEKAVVAIGMTQLEKGDLTAAEQTLTKAAQSLSATREVFYALGEVNFAKNDPAAAAKWYQKAVDTDPTWVKPIFKLGLVALNRGDKAGALQYMEKVVQVDPTSPEAAQAKAIIGQLKP